MADDPPLPDWLNDDLTHDKLLEQCHRLNADWPLPDNGGVFRESQKIRELKAGLYKLGISSPVTPELNDGFVEKVKYWSKAKQLKLFDDFHASVELIVAAIKNSLPAAPMEMPAAPSSEGKPVDEANDTRHSIDFASVNWYGTPYTFTTNQAACVRVLWEAWKNKTPVLGGVTIIDAAGVDRSDERLDLVFRDNPAWNAMIVSPSKGRYCLKAPDAAT